MTDLVKYIKRKVPSPCCVKRCNKEGCKVDLTQAPRPFVLIDMDCRDLEIERGSNRCDFLFAGQGDGDVPGWVAALELKGRPKASKVRAQLQSGAQFAERILPKDVEIRFRPVLFYRGGLRGAELTLLRGSSIRFRHPTKGIVLKERVILRRCGSRLKDALRE